MNSARLPLLATLLLAATTAHSEMRGLDDSEMADVSGQDGVSLSVNFNLAANTADTRCTGGCGARLAIQRAWERGADPHGT